MGINMEYETLKYKRILRFIKVKNGWKDLGAIGDSHRIENGETIYTIQKHTFCSTRIRIGKEKNTLFYFCPMCKVKI